MNTSKIAAGALALLLCAGANAHRVNIFAWIEGDQVVTESKFSSGSRVQKGAVTVKNAADGSVLATGVTDDAGVWRFDVTQAMRHAPKGLELEINAGEGIRINGRFPLMSLLRPTEPAHPSSRQLLPSARK